MKYIIFAYLKYIVLYVVLVPVVIVLIQGGNFGGPFMFGFMLVVAPVISLGIPKKVISMNGVNKLSTKGLIYCGHSILAFGLQFAAIAYVADGAMSGWSLM